MPGAGKSTVGIVLAKMLNYDFLDADLIIQRRFDTTLQRMINSYGAEDFIAIEGEVLCDIDSNLKNTIIATGGSAVYSEKAMAHLGSFSHIVYLRIPLDEMEMRIGDLSERGVVLRSGATMSLSDLYAEREPLYERFARTTVDVGGLAIAEAANRVKEILESI